MAKTSPYAIKTGTFQDLLTVNAGVELYCALETLTTLQNSLSHALSGLAIVLENEPDHFDSRLLWSLSYLSELTESIGQACIQKGGV